MIWLNGNFVPPEAAIDARDRGLLLGESLFETILVENTHAQFWHPHLARLKKGCALLGFDSPHDDTALGAARDALIKDNRARLALRLTVTGGAGGRGLEREGSANWIMQSFPAPPVPPFLRLHISTITRQAGHPLAEVKSGNYLDNILARQAAKRAAADEAVLLNQYGRVAGCAAGNIYVSLGDDILTPPIAEGALGGIIRQVLLGGEAVREAPLTQKMLQQADTLAVSNSLLGVVAAGFLDAEKAHSKVTDLQKTLRQQV